MVTYIISRFIESVKPFTTTMYQNEFNFYTPILNHNQSNE